MILPTCNVKLRAEATQRKNIYTNAKELSGNNTTSAVKKVIQLLIAEICYNLDFELMKRRLEEQEGGYNT